MQHKFLVLLPVKVALEVFFARRLKVAGGTERLVCRGQEMLPAGEVRLRRRFVERGHLARRTEVSWILLLELAASLASLLAVNTALAIQLLVEADHLDLLLTLYGAGSTSGNRASAQPAGLHPSRAFA